MTLLLPFFVVSLFSPRIAAGTGPPSETPEQRFCARDKHTLVERTPEVILWQHCSAFWGEDLLTGRIIDLLRRAPWCLVGILVDEIQDVRPAQLNVGTEKRTNCAIMRALRELQKRVFLQTGVTFFTLAIGIDYDPSMQPTSTGVTDVMNNTDDALYSTFSDVYRIMKHFNKVDPRRGW